MATDIKITTETHKFKYRVNGIVIKNGKLLTIKMKNGTSFCLPGGHAELGEDTHTAVIREMKEELNSEATISSELAIVESFYTDKNGLSTHEISFYYIVEPVNYDNIPLENYSTKENDKGEMKDHNFEWIELSKLENVDFRPAFIKTKLAKGDFTFEHMIIKE